MYDNINIAMKQCENKRYMLICYWINLKDPNVVELE